MVSTYHTRVSGRRTVCSVTSSCTVVRTRPWTRPLAPHYSRGRGRGKGRGVGTCAPVHHCVEVAEVAQLIPAALANDVGQITEVTLPRDAVTLPQ